MVFRVGSDVLYRDYRGNGQLVLVIPQRVVADDERGLLTWRPVGTPWLFRRTADGRDRREIPFHLRHTVEWRLAPLTWTGLHVLHLFRPGHAHSVWWMFNPDFTLNRWYVNLEAPPARWADDSLAGVDTFDHALDIVVTPDRQWHWKDEVEYLERAGHPDYWTTDQAADIRAEGERVIKDIEAGAFPFDGTWRDFGPGPAWPLPALPHSGWDRPAAIGEPA
jgi:predicted RNA-binding protein associated with RNAse of E/G family